VADFVLYEVERCYDKLPQSKRRRSLVVRQFCCWGWRNFLFSFPREDRSLFRYSSVSPYRSRAFVLN